MFGSSDKSEWAHVSDYDGFEDASSDSVTVNGCRDTRHTICVKRNDFSILDRNNDL